MRYKALSQSEIVDLQVVGFLTDGGLDSGSEPGGGAVSSVPAVKEKEVEMFRLPEGNPSWAGNAFEPDERCYSSDVAPDQGAAANVLLIGRVACGVSAELAVARAATAARRAFLLARMSSIPGLLPQSEDFGGVASMDAATVDNCFMQLLGHPNGVELLLLDLDGAERAAASRQLRQYAESTPDWNDGLREDLIATRQQGSVLVVDRATWQAAQADDPLDGGASRDSPESLGMGGSEVALASSTTLDDPLLCSLRRPWSTLAVVTRHCLRRALHCSCPAQVGFVLGCRAPLRPSALYSERMLALNDCLSLDVFPESAQEAAAAGSSLPVIRDVITTDEAVICEFERNINDTEGGAFPIIWFRFTSTLAAAAARKAATPGWREQGAFEYRLQQPRCTSFLLVKIVAPENRMEAMGDEHMQPNIDLQYCGARGIDLEQLQPRHLDEGGSAG